MLLLLNWVFILIVLLVALAVVLLFVGMSRVFNTKPVPHAGIPDDLGIEYETVRFHTTRNLLLQGWWIPSPAPEMPVLILVHGWRRNVERMLPYIEALHLHFNLFAYDSRNHGNSASDNFTSMPRFKDDILAALDYLDTRKDAGQKKRSVLGLSMGGGAAIYAAAKDERIDRVVTVGAFANAADIMKREYKKRHIPYYPMVYLLFEYFQYRIGERFDAFAPEVQIGRASAIFLIIHGKMDQTTPFEQGERLVRAANGKAELWGIEQAGHSDCHTFPGFWEKVIHFLQAPSTGNE